MANIWREMSFGQAFSIGPRIMLNRGVDYPFIDMAAIEPGYRCVHAIESRVFRGSGSVFAAGDTLMARITPCLENGKIARYCATSPLKIAHGSTEFIVIRGRAGITDSGFAYYFITSPFVRKYAISQMIGTSGRQRVPVNVLSELIISIPSLPEQQAITAFLSIIDDKIELNRKMNETLEAMAQALFKSWFIDFDPVRAKVEGRQSNIMTEINNLFPSKFQNSIIGPIPFGWNVSKFSDLLQSNIGGSWGVEAPSDICTEKVHIIRGTDFSTIQDGFKRNIPCRYVENKIMVNRQLTDADIIIEISGGSPKQPTGRSIFITNSIIKRFNDPVLPASFCRRFRPINSLYSCLLYYHLQNLYLLGGTWKYQNQSTGISNFQTSYFLENEYVINPEPNILKLFHKIIMPMIEKINMNENIYLSSIRDLLLPKLISGEIRIKEAEKAIGAVL